MNPGHFFVLMCVLQVADAVTTAKGMRLGASEANGLLKGLMKAVGVNEALLLVKVAYLVYLWHYPVSVASAQAFIAALYVAAIANNLRVIRRRKKAN